MVAGLERGCKLHYDIFSKNASKSAALSFPDELVSKYDRCNV